MEWAAAIASSAARHVGQDGDGAARVHVDVHQHLLGRGTASSVLAVEHLVVDQQPLAVDAEDPCGDAQRLVLRRLAEVVDVRLDGVEAVAVGAVLLVVADVA